MLVGVPFTLPLLWLPFNTDHPEPMLQTPRDGKAAQASQSHGVPDPARVLSEAQAWFVLVLLLLHQGPHPGADCQLGTAPGTPPTPAPKAHSLAPQENPSQKGLSCI